MYKNYAYHQNTSTRPQAVAIAAALPEEERRESRLLWPIQAFALGASTVVTALLYLVAFAL